jgi:sugar diacid utilization regulator
LSAYRIGARVAWQRMSETAVEQGVDAGSMARFAELVFAYIDELSAASVAGHTDELATTGRVRQRLLERLATQLLEGAPAETVAATAERADWQLPETLTAVLVPESQVRTVLQALPGETLSAPEGATEEAEDGMVLLLVPDVHGHRRGAVLRVLEGRGSVAGPARTPDEVAASYARAQRVRALGGGPDSEEHLAALVLHADEGALRDLRARVLAPLDDVREGTREKLEETLRAWLLHHGRREDVAAELFVHPQTVRYRMTQLRELFGDALEDPARVLDLTLALGSAAG